MEVWEKGGNWIRPVTIAVALLGLAGTVWSTVVFARWVTLDNAITYPAVEIGKAPAYPAGHGDLGLIAALCVVTFATITLVSAWLTVDAWRRRITSVGRVALLVSAAILVGLSIPAVIQYAALGVIPLIAGACLMFPLVRNAAPRP